MRTSTSTPNQSVGGWLTTGTWTVLDQGLFAGSNFIVNVLLARWLTPDEYGAYTVAFTLFLLLGTFHGGLFIEPMLVFGSGRFESRLRHYLRVLLRGHGWFSLFAGVVLALAAGGFWLAGEAELARALLVLSVAQAAILALWMMRGACYIRFQPRLAVIAGVGYAVVLLGGAALENHYGHLTVTTALEWMAIASLLATGWLWLRLGVPFRRKHDAALTEAAVRDHREYGKWAVATGGMEWVQTFLPFLILPLWAGLEGTGALRALFNFILPILHIYHAFGNLLVPLFVRARAGGALRRTATLALGGMLAMSVGYAVTLDVFGPALIGWLYGGKYDAYANLLWLVGLLPVGMGCVAVAQAVLRAMEKPRSVFLARSGAAGIVATIGTASVWAFGVAGALFSSLMAALTEGAIMFGQLKKDDFMKGDTVPLPSVSGRKRVLMVAYACGPGRGSEPGQGWEFARGTAAHHDVWVLVYAGFRKAIERRLAEEPAPGLHVVYHRLPFERVRHWREGEDRTGLVEQLHYYLWQRSAGWVARRLHRQVGFDLTHHVSFMRYWSPSAAAAPDVPMLWGPVGGGESAPKAFYRSFGRRGWWAERLRDLARGLAHLDPAVRGTARAARLALAATPETAERMRALGASPVEVRDGVALGDDTLATLRQLGPPGDGPVRFISVGRLLHWKGYGFALDAFAAALASGDPAMEGAHYEIVGEGPDAGRLRAMARRLGLDDRVTFRGRLPRPEALALLGEAHVFVHPSFHDCGGYATLEGMAAGRPVLCLALGGPDVQVTPETGIAVEAETPVQVVRDLASAMRRLAADPALRRRMGEAARLRVEADFRWTHVVERTVARYDEIAPSMPLGDGQAVGDPVWSVAVPADTDA